MTTNGPIEVRLSFDQLAALFGAKPVVARSTKLADYEPRNERPIYHQSWGDSGESFCGGKRDPALMQGGTWLPCPSCLRIQADVTDALMGQPWFDDQDHSAGHAERCDLWLDQEFERRRLERP